VREPSAGQPGRRMALPSHRGEQTRRPGTPIWEMLYPRAFHSEGVRVCIARAWISEPISAASAA
jgi:hypothetical protein